MTGVVYWLAEAPLWQLYDAMLIGLLVVVIVIGLVHEKKRKIW